MKTHTPTHTVTSAVETAVLSERETPVHESFGHQVMEYLEPLYRVALGLTRHARDAEDLVQETFLRAIAKQHAFQAGTNLRAWLMTMMRNIFINMYRRKQRRPNEVGIAELEGAFGAEEIPEVSVAQPAGQPLTQLGELLDDPVRTALFSMPERFRFVFLLASVEGYSYQEIADVLDVPIGTVMSRLHRARQHMLERLEEYGEETGWVRHEVGACA